MKKERITPDGIKSDFLKIARQMFSDKADWRFTYIIPITLLAVLMGILLKNIIVGLLVFSVAAYHIVRYVSEYKEYRTKKNAIKALDEREDISVSTEILSHIANETVYEPHVTYGGVKNTRTVTRYFFSSGASWREPRIDNHYSWSKEFYMSSNGLENISISGDEFFFISLQEHHDISYIYPCKNFELDISLKK